MSSDAPYPHLSATASLSFSLTGVAPLSSRYGRLCDKSNSTTTHNNNNNNNNDGDEENDEDDFPHPTQSRCESKSNSHCCSSSRSSGSSRSSNRDRNRSNASDVTADEEEGDDEAGPIGSSLPPVVFLHAQDAPHPPTPVHVVDDVVPCNLVPLLPRTHGQFGLVAQIVPCALWPPLAPGPRDTLQNAARTASRQHERSVRGGPAAASPAEEPNLPGTLVEWTTGAVGYTIDTAGLWAEQRIVSARHYSLAPKNPTRGAAPARRAGTLQSVVREQMCRMFRAGRGGAGEGKLRPLFARVVEMPYVLVESFNHSVKGHMHTAAVCDALLDEAISFGIAPRGEPHKLVLLHTSFAHRALLESRRGASGPHGATRTAVKLEEEEEEEEEEDEIDERTIQEEAEDKLSVTEALFELILIALRDVLHRRIGVQYELLRILRVKSLAATHSNLIRQHMYWLSTVPSPVAVLNALAGSTLFGALAARRWPPSGHTRDPEDEDEGRKRESDEAPGGMATRGRLRLRVRAAEKGEERAAPTEADLLEDSYMTRFAEQMRRPGPPGNTAVCDETALTETVRWFRKYRRTMTPRELDAFARRKL